MSPVALFAETKINWGLISVPAFVFIRSGAENIYFLATIYYKVITFSEKQVAIQYSFAVFVNVGAGNVYMRPACGRTPERSGTCGSLTLNISVKRTFNSAESARPDKK